MQFRLRTLLIVLALAPPVIATAWWTFSTVHWEERKVTDAGLAFAMVVAFILTYIVACLIVGLLFAGVISAINWLIAKIQDH